MHPLLIFNDEKLLQRALTHRSYNHENPDATGHNERLEYLGDAILTFMSAEYLYRLSPERDEGEMTRRRSALVDEKQLARFATEVGLGSQMRLGQGVLKAGGVHNSKLLSSTFEAVVGAYYLDKNRDIEAIRPLVEALFGAVPENVVAARSHVAPKNELQELIQAEDATALPVYDTEQTGGTDHQPEFTSQVKIGETRYGEGRGRSKREAATNAAIDALTQIKRRGGLCP
ncbi:ribonuclease III [Romeria aff. gracilis LEGE 07310]|uniref:Ribonuclease 3 n=1 Tax=Vasconcelosia minhoensis LEGE 07310 TaxID=915328 RepID=A0A8J7AVL0_9CYAN|nr:ribonuclease III [Romeria gracilis]MBE9077793.1 ribonuclease III [Romeria aff. gracilis LEGE 07310]